MRKYVRRKHDANLRTDRVCTEHSAVFDATPGGQKTRTALHTYVQDIGGLLGTQESSIEDRRAATNQCRQCRRSLRNAGKAVVRVGKLVNLDEDVMKTMQLPGPGSDSDLVAYMRGLLDRVSAHADAFVAEGLPPNLLKNLSDRIDAFETARNDRNAARERFTHSVEGFQALGIAWGSGNALSGMARVALTTGDAGQAERLLDEATAVLRPAGPWFRSLTLYLRALLAVRRGNPDEAIAFVRESLVRIRQLHDKFSFVYALVPLAAAAVLKGDDAWAARILGARDAVTESTGATVADQSVRDLREQAEREARTRFGAERWARAYAAGRTSSIDSLLKDIDHVVVEKASAG